VTFDQEDKGGASTLYRLLPTPQRMAKMVEVLILTKDKKASARGRDGDAEVDDLDELEDGEEDAQMRDSASASRSGDDNSHRRGGRAGRVPAPAMGWRIGKKRPSPADKIVADWKKATGGAKSDKRASGWEKPTPRGGVASRDGAGVKAGAGKDSYTVAHVPSQKTIDEDAEVGFIALSVCHRMKRGES
jgi:hypothetical protein